MNNVHWHHWHHWHHEYLLVTKDLRTEEKTVGTFQREMHLVHQLLEHVVLHISQLEHPESLLEVFWMILGPPTHEEPGNSVVFWPCMSRYSTNFEPCNGVLTCLRVALYHVFVNLAFDYLNPKWMNVCTNIPNTWAHTTWTCVPTILIYFISGKSRAAWVGVRSVGLGD